MTANEICNDNRFELIEKYKKELIEATNIETAPDEMAVLDNILFRFWQMGWLDKLELPSAQPTLYGYNIEHLELIARVLQKEDLPPERIVEALTDIGRIVAIVTDEFEESLRKAVEQCTLTPDTDLENLSSGTWDTKELSTTQPDKIEVHLRELSSAQPKPLKYSGTSICCHCKTTNCDGCLYEPMAERREE